MSIKTVKRFEPNIAALARYVWDMRRAAARLREASARDNYEEYMAAAAQIECIKEQYRADLDALAVQS